MRLAKLLAVCVVAALSVAGLAACDGDPTVKITAVYGPSSDPDGNQGVWYMNSRANGIVFVFTDSDMIGTCTLNIPAQPVVPNDPTTQIHLSLTSNVVNDAKSRVGIWPGPISPAKVPPGTYASALVCSGNATSPLHDVTLLPNSNEFRSIAPTTLTNSASQQLQLTGTDLGTSCTLHVQGDSVSNPGTAADLDLPVTLGSANGDGVITNGTATWPANQTTLASQATVVTRLICTGRSDSRTKSVALTDPSNGLTSIGVSNFSANVDQALTIAATDMGTSCQLHVVGPSVADHAVNASLDLPVTLNAANGSGTVTGGTATWLHSQTAIANDVSNTAVTLNCVGRSNSGTLSVALNDLSNQLTSIGVTNFSTTFDQPLTIAATNMGTSCQLHVTGPAVGHADDTAELDLPVTLNAPNGNGIVTGGTATWDHSQNSIASHIGSTDVTLNCTGRINSGTLTVPLA